MNSYRERAQHLIGNIERMIRENPNDWPETDSAAFLELDELRNIIRELCTEYQSFSKQRDVMRREICEWACLTTKRTPQAYAKARGWNLTWADDMGDPGDECQREAL